MNTSDPMPLVSVSMVTYNAEAFVAEAIEGVLAQQVDFPLELVIGDDASTDSTRDICRQYATRHPGRIRLLPPQPNLGIAGNTARTLQACTGKYIAICDGDDVWADPFKLRDQVAFLEQNPAYGLVYTDVETVSETGRPILDPAHELIRRTYAEGDVFFTLLQGNFINNSTVLFRRDLIADYTFETDRRFYIQDHLLWLHVSIRGRIRFFPARTTLYRKHAGALTHSTFPAKSEGNRQRFLFNLFRIFPVFDRHYSRPIRVGEKTFLFRRMLSLLCRNSGAGLIMKWRILRMMPRYFPGLGRALGILWTKVRGRADRVPFATNPQV